MRNEVMEFYGLKRSLRSAGYFLTAHHRDLLDEVKHAIYDGTLIVLSGVIGAGKTAAITRLQETLLEEDRVVVSTSVSVEKNRVALGTLITALFCDLSTEKEVKIPKSGELRDRALRALVKKRKKPVVLFIDDAHDLHRNTLVALKRLIELVKGAGATLSIVLVGHPRLRNEMQDPAMEEVGYRTAIFSLEGVAGSQREYMTWLIETCGKDGVTIDDVLEPAAPATTSFSRKCGRPPCPRRRRTPPRPIIQLTSPWPCCGRSARGLFLQNLKGQGLGPKQAARPIPPRPCCGRTGRLAQ